MDDCKGKWIPRLGEVHTVIAELRAVGNAIEYSVLGEAYWFEAEIYGPTTTRHILEAKDMKIALEVHVTTVQALRNLYVKIFFLEHSQFMYWGSSAKSCIQHNTDVNKTEEHDSYLNVNKIFKLMAKLEDKKEANVPLFKFMRRYMRMCVSYSYTHSSKQPVMACGNYT